MAKKSFKSGFDDLFGDALRGNFGEPKEVHSKTTKNKKNKGKKGGKQVKSDLAANIDSFLQGAIKESIKEQAEELKNGKTAAKKKSKRTKPVFGLDALIRQTVETSKIEAVVEGDVKRVTFFFNKKKMERLKQIARSEKAYMKDIIAELVSNYIEKYEKQSA